MLIWEEDILMVSEVISVKVVVKMVCIVFCKVRIVIDLIWGK